MRASLPSGIIPYVWDNDNDDFSNAQLAANDDAIDAAIAALSNASQLHQVATLPGGLNNTTDRGHIVYLTSADGGFAAKSFVVWNGTSWNSVSLEILAAVPVSGNYVGRLIYLTQADSGFNQFTLIVYNGTSWAAINSGIELKATVPGSGNFAGRLVLLTAADSGFEAFSLIAYDGSSWHRTEKRGVEVGTALPGSPYRGQIFYLTANAGGFWADDAVQWNGSAWRRINDAQPGDIKWTASTAVPTNWLACDGASYLRATYASLFTAIGTTFGSADGTHFNVPDMRGRVVAAYAASGGHTDVSTLGNSDGVAAANRRPKHRHSPHVHVYGSGIGYAYASSTTGSATDSFAQGGTADRPSLTVWAISGSTASADGGSGTSTDALDAPAYIVLNALIKA